jgi:biotin operon repressor
MFNKIIIRRIRKPLRPSLNAELQWLGDSLGLFSPRDKDKSCFRIFIELIKATRNQQALSSDELAYKLDLSRGTVVHHIHKLMESGLVIVIHKRYMLREPNLHILLDQIQADFTRQIAELRVVAELLDGKLGM